MQPSEQKESSLGQEVGRLCGGETFCPLDSGSRGNILSTSWDGRSCSHPLVTV
jgi:hypothetical protein